MVQQALNRHSQIVIPPETKFFFSFFGHPWKHQVRHIERLNTDLGICLPRPPAPVDSLAEGRAYYDAMARQYVARLQRRDTVYFGDKTPEHTGHLPRIREMFPDAKILVLYRDGRDVALSLTQVPWMSTDLYVNFLVWLYYSWVVRKARDYAWPNLLFARYEDIVTSPEKELGRILQFLGLPEEPAVSQRWGNREGVPAREYAWKARAFQKITTERVGIFRQELSSAQIDILEHLGGRALTNLDYPLLTDGQRPLPRGFLLSLAYNFSRFVYRLPWHAVVREVLNRLVPGCPEEPSPLSASLRVAG
jgi:hypothetical protein